jgi:hypothetical protein
MPTRSQLTPRTALLFGLVCIAFALIPILAGLGIIPVKTSDGTPAWVAVGAGLLFLFAGAILLSDAAAGGTGPDGQLLATAPAWVKPFQWVMGFAIMSMFASIFSWIAFGSGERHFQGSISLPFFSTHSPSSETEGRWAFGIGAVIMWCVVAGVVASTARKALARSKANAAKE